MAKKLKFLIWDTGLSLAHSLRLAKDGHQVFYYTPWQTAFPRFQDYAIGLGFENEGLYKIKHFWDYIDKVDYIVFFDIGAGDMANFLRSKGYKVYGASKGERLEEERFNSRKIQKTIGLPVQQTVKVQGINNLRKYLKSNPNKYVKLDLFRGDVDSFYAKDYESVIMLLDEIETAFGPFKEKKAFICEDYIKAITEFGNDAFFNSRKFLTPHLFGREMSKASYVGKWTNNLPSVLQNTLDKLTPVFQKLDYRGAFSSEERVVSKDKSYLIDMCCRLPFPLSAGYTEAITNFTEIIVAIAEGKDIEIKPKNKYLITLPLETQHAQNNWVKLDFNPKLLTEGKIKIRCATKIDNKYYMVKGLSTAYILISCCDTIKQGIKEIEEVSKEVDCVGLDKDGIGGLYKIQEEIEEINNKLKWNF